MRRVPGCKVTPYYGKIQDKDDDYYMQFNIVICGLDSVEARRWMNATLVRLVDPEVEESLKPLIDGGTEGTQHSLLSHLVNSDPSLSSTRLQRASKSHPPYYYCMLRMLPRSPHSTNHLSSMHNPKYTPPARTLYLLGKRTRMATGLQGQEDGHR